jgi:hypothetical protein
MGPKIEFVSTVEALNDIEECKPKPAKHFIPKWFKDIPNDIEHTVKICPSFPDYFSRGYVVPMWTDLEINIDKETKSWSWNSPPHTFKVEYHTDRQFIDHTKASFKGVDGQGVFKFLSPWKVITPPGWSVLQLPLFYHFENNFSVLPGVIDTDIHHDINQQVLYHGNGETIKINRGDPLALYIPYKRSEKLDLVTRFQTDKDKKLFTYKDYRFRTTFIGKGLYRRMQRERDKDV